MKRNSYSHKNNHIAYVTNPNGVSVIDTVKDTVTAFILTGEGYLGGIAFTRDGTRAFVVEYDRVFVIDTKTNNMMTTISGVGSAAQDIVLTPDGTHAFVTNFDSDNVSVINTTNYKVIGHPIPVGENPTHAAIT